MSMECLYGYSIHKLRDFRAIYRLSPPLAYMPSDRFYDILSICLESMAIPYDILYMFEVYGHTL